MVLELISATVWVAGGGSAAGHLISTMAATGSVAAMTVFIVYTFLPTSLVGRGCAALLLALAGASLAVPALGAGFASPEFYTESGWISSLARSLAFGWAALAAARSRSALRKRARLGLSHPATASRVGSWSLSAALAAGSYALPLVELGLRGVQPGGISPLSMILAIGASVSIWLAFQPPRRYLEWVLRRAERT